MMGEIGGVLQAAVLVLCARRGRIQLSISPRRCEEHYRSPERSQALEAARHIWLLLGLRRGERKRTQYHR